jgi:hypothetical protein
MPTTAPNRHGPRTTTLAAVLLLVIIMMLAIVPASTLAAGPPDGAGSGNGGMGHGGPDRDVEVDMEPKRARIRSTVSGSDGGSGGGDALDYDIQAGNRLTVEMQYRNKAEAQQANVQMTVTFHQMIEYEDLDDDGQLGPGDEVVSTYDLETASWDDLVHGEEAGEDGKMVHTITARTSDGVFAMVSHTTETRTMTQHGEISPNLMKIDLVVEDFPWTRTTTRLALQATIGTEGPVTHIGDPAQREYMGDNEAGIETLEDGDVGFYTWVRSADVDGASSQVRARVIEDGEGTTLQFDYEQGASILHDPKLGVPLVDEGLFDVMELLVPYIAALGIGAVIAGVAVYARRRSDS